MMLSLLGHKFDTLREIGVLIGMEHSKDYVQLITSI
jgi:hypothetical protein